MKTAVVEARLDIRTLAALYNYFDGKGRRPSSRSDLIWLAVEMLTDGLRLERPSVTDSLLVFQHTGWDMTKGGRTGRALAKALQEDALNADFALPQESRDRNLDEELTRVIANLGKELGDE